MSKKITAAFRVRQHKDQGFEVQNGELWCGRCAVKIKYEKAHIVKVHLDSEKHKKWTRAVENSTTIRTTSQLENQWKTMLEAFVGAQIPLNVFRNKKFREWMTKNVKLGHLLPSETTLRVNLKDLGEEDIQGTIKICKDKDVVMIADETTDIKCRKILNILVKPLDLNQKPRLIVSKRIEKCDAKVITSEIIKAMQVLELDLDHLVTFVTDNAPYMILAGTNLSGVCPRLLHTTCWAHVLHLLAEEVRSEMPFTDEFISGMKKALLKAPARQDEYQTFMVKNNRPLQLPPIPVLTRWTTWLKAGSFHWNNFDAIVDWIKNTKDNGATMEALKYLLTTYTDDIALQLERVDKIFPNLSTGLMNIESNKIIASEVWSSLNLIESHIKSLGLSMTKLNLYLHEKHPAASFWKDVQVLDPRKCPNDITTTFPPSLRRFSVDPVPEIEFEKYRQFSTFEQRRLSSPIMFWQGYRKEMPILSKLALKALAVPPSSADVERSFSYYKKILDPQRTGLNENNASTHVRISFNENPGGTDVEENLDGDVDEEIE